MERQAAPPQLPHMRAVASAPSLPAATAPAGTPAGSRPGSSSSLAAAVAARLAATGTGGGGGGTPLGSAPPAPPPVCSSSGDGSSWLRPPVPAAIPVALPAGGYHHHHHLHHSHTASALVPSTAAPPWLPPVPTPWTAVPPPHHPPYFHPFAPSPYYAGYPPPPHPYGFVLMPYSDATAAAAAAAAGGRGQHNGGGGGSSSDDDETSGSRSSDGSDNRGGGGGDTPRSSVGLPLSPTPVSDAASPWPTSSSARSPLPPAPSPGRGALRSVTPVLRGGGGSGGGSAGRRAMSQPPITSFMGFLSHATLNGGIDGGSASSPGLPPPHPRSLLPTVSQSSASSVSTAATSRKHPAEFGGPAGQAATRQSSAVAFGSFTTDEAEAMHRRARAANLIRLRRAVTSTTGIAPVITAARAGVAAPTAPAAEPARPPFSLPTHAPLPPPLPLPSSESLCRPAPPPPAVLPLPPAVASPTVLPPPPLPLPLPLPPLPVPLVEKPVVPAPPRVSLAAVMAGEELAARGRAPGRSYMHATAGQARVAAGSGGGGSAATSGAARTGMMAAAFGSLPSAIGSGCSGGGSGGSGGISSRIAPMLHHSLTAATAGDAGGGRSDADSLPALAPVATALLRSLSQASDTEPHGGGGGELPPARLPLLRGVSNESLASTGGTRRRTRRAAAIPAAHVRLAQFYSVSGLVVDDLRMMAALERGPPYDAPVFIRNSFAPLLKKTMLGRLRDGLAADAKHVLNEPNAGGNSEKSEALSLEILHKCHDMRLWAGEMEIRYQLGSPIIDFIALKRLPPTPTPPASVPHVPPPALQRSHSTRYLQVGGALLPSAVAASAAALAARRAATAAALAAGGDGYSPSTALLPADRAKHAMMVARAAEERSRPSSGGYRAAPIASPPPAALLPAGSGAVYDSPSPLVGSMRLVDMGASVAGAAPGPAAAAGAAAAAAAAASVPAAAAAPPMVGHRVALLPVGVDDLKVGVSVTRAMKFLGGAAAYNVEDAVRILTKKLAGILQAREGVESSQRWDRQLLHIWAEAPHVVEVLFATLHDPTLIPPHLWAHTIVLCTEAPPDTMYRIIFKNEDFDYATAPRPAAVHRPHHHHAHRASAPAPTTAPTDAAAGGSGGGGAGPSRGRAKTHAAAGPVVGPPPPPCDPPLPPPVCLPAPTVVAPMPLPPLVPPPAVALVRHGSDV